MTRDSFPPLIELRQYMLRPGRRDELIELFAREFVAGQETAGVVVLGYFRDLDNPDRFVWLRGFRDHDARPVALGRFYGGKIWARRRDTVNAMLVDSDDVLQLRPVGEVRALTGAGMIVALVLLLDAPADEQAVAQVDAELTSGLDRAGGTRLGTLVTDPTPNNFPQLPLRDHDNALVHLCAFANRHRGDAWSRAITRPGALYHLALRERPVPLRLAAA